MFAAAEVHVTAAVAHTFLGRHTSHLHGLPEGAAVGQAVIVEGTQVTATPVLNDVALSSTPVQAHGGALEGLQGVTGEKNAIISRNRFTHSLSVSLSIQTYFKVFFCHDEHTMKLAK